MKGSDLKCPVCGAGAKDVAPDYDLAGSDDPWFVAPQTWGVLWTCTAGHKHISGVRDRRRGLESMRAEDP